MSKSIENQILITVSNLKKKYYFNPEYDKLPEEIQTKLRVICAVLAEKTGGVVTLAFQPSGDVFFELGPEDGDISYDEIGAALELKEAKRDNKEILTTLKLWYLMYKTDYGELFRRVLELNHGGTTSPEEIISKLTKEYGEEVRETIEEILDTI